MRPEFEGVLKSLPTKPGVYLFRSTADKILYVGKAVNLRARVRSYFHVSAQQAPKTRRLVEDIAAIEFIVSRSELEALLLDPVVPDRAAAEKCLEAMLQANRAHLPRFFG